MAGFRLTEACTIAVSTGIERLEAGRLAVRTKLNTLYARLRRSQLGLAVRLQRLTLGVEADRIFQACLASFQPVNDFFKTPQRLRSEEHTSELQSLMRISYAVFCLKKKKIK